MLLRLLLDTVLNSRSLCETVIIPRTLCKLLLVLNRRARIVAVLLNVFICEINVGMYNELLVKCYYLFKKMKCNVWYLQEGRKKVTHSLNFLFSNCLFICFCHIFIY